MPLYPTADSFPSYTLCGFDQDNDKSTGSMTQMHEPDYGTSTISLSTRKSNQSKQQKISSVICRAYSWRSKRKRTFDLQHSETKPKCRLRWTIRQYILRSATIKLSWSIFSTYYIGWKICFELRPFFLFQFKLHCHPYPRKIFLVIHQENVSLLTVEFRWTSKSDSSRHWDPSNDMSSVLDSLSPTSHSSGAFHLPIRFQRIRLSWEWIVNGNIIHRARR